MSPIVKRLPLKRFNEKDAVDYMVEMDIDLVHIMLMMGNKARNNASQRSTAMAGDITVRVRPCAYPKKEATHDRS